MQLATRQSIGTDAPTASANVIDTEDEEHLITLASRRLKFQPDGPGQRACAQAVGNGWRRAPADDFWANRQVDFIHQAGAEQRGVELSAALAKQAFDSPLVTKLWCDDITPLGRPVVPDV